MAHCVWCGDKGIFLKVDNNHVCRVCQTKVYPDIKAKTESVLHCYKRLKETEVLKVKLTVGTIMLTELAELRKYEAKHIPTPDIDIDLRGVFANTKDVSSMVEIKVDTHSEEAKAWKAATGEYNTKYGKLPDEIYSSSMGVKNVVGYLRGIMEGYVKNGVSTLSEIDAAIRERRPFVGPHAKGILEDGGYKVYVGNDLIYNEKEGMFDSEWKRYSIYSDIQDAVAKHIYHKDLKTIRKERKKVKKGAS